jgi:hypothetical protein
MMNLGYSINNSVGSHSLPNLLLLDISTNSLHEDVPVSDMSFIVVLSVCFALGPTDVHCQTVVENVSVLIRADY